MRQQRSEILSRLVRFLDMDTDGLRRFIIQYIVEGGEFTVASLHAIVSQRFNISVKVLASMIGYICSRLGILHVAKKSYRAPKTYILRSEYADVAESALLNTL
jgi:hypothetical protein